MRTFDLLADRNNGTTSSSNQGDSLQGSTAIVIGCVVGASVLIILFGLCVIKIRAARTQKEDEKVLKYRMKRKSSKLDAKSGGSSDSTIVTDLESCEDPIRISFRESADKYAPLTGRTTLIKKHSSLYKEHYLDPQHTPDVIPYYIQSSNSADGESNINTRNSLQIEMDSEQKIQDFYGIRRQVTDSNDDASTYISLASRSAFSRSRDLEAGTHEEDASEIGKFSYDHFSQRSKFSYLVQAEGAPYYPPVRDSLESKASTQPNHFSRRKIRFQLTEEDENDPPLSSMPALVPENDNASLNGSLTGSLISYEIEEEQNQVNYPNLRTVSSGDDSGIWIKLKKNKEAVYDV